MYRSERGPRAASAAGGCIRTRRAIDRAIDLGTIGLCTIGHARGGGLGTVGLARGGGGFGAIG